MRYLAENTFRRVNYLLHVNFIAIVYTHIQCVSVTDPRINKQARGFYVQSSMRRDLEEIADALIRISIVS